MGVYFVNAGSFSSNARISCETCVNICKNRGDQGVVTRYRPTLLLHQPPAFITWKPDHQYFTK